MMLRFQFQQMGTIW